MTRAYFKRGGVFLMLNHLNKLYDMVRAEVE